MVRQRIIRLALDAPALTNSAWLQSGRYAALFDRHAER
jgi:hypothetical protein